MSTAPGSTPPAQSSGGLGPWLSALVRPAAKAAASLPLMAADTGTAIGNIASGQVPLRDPEGNINWMLRNYNGGMPLPSQTFNNALDSVTTAPTGVGKGAEFLNTVLLGAKLPGMPSSSPVAAGARSATSALTPAQQAALAGGQQLGMRTTPGAASGSTPLLQLEAKLESQPWTSGPFSALKGGNQTALNSTAARAIGEESNVVDSTVMGRAADRLGKTFENTRNPDSILAVDPNKEAGILDEIDQNYSGLLPNGASITSHPLVSQFQTLMSQGGANLQQLGQLSSKLGKAGFKQMTSLGGDRDMGQALYDVKNHVDDLVQGALSPAQAAEYAAARAQWRTLATLTKPGVVNPSSGNVSGTVLANTLARTDKPGFLYGNNTSPLYQAARFAQAFRPIVGDSGTATRSSSELLPLLGAVLGGGGAHVAGHGATEGAGVGALAAPVMANALSRLYLSQAGGNVARSLAAIPGAAQRSLPATIPAGLLAASVQ